MTDSQRPIISVVLPLFQEAAHLSEVLARIDQELAALSEPYEIILIDDGSYDDTWSVIVAEGECNKAIVALQLSRNFGKEAALLAGLRLARGSAVITMDADLQHPPELLPQMHELWRSGQAEIVEAVKAVRGEETIFYKLAAKIFYLLMNALAGVSIANASDFKLLDRKVVNVLLCCAERKPFYRGLTAWAGFRVTRIPFMVADRIGGVSRWSFFALAQLFVNALTSFSNVPLSFVSMSGLVFLLFAIGLGSQTMYNYCTGRAVSGFTTVILLILITGSWLMLCLGVVGTYLGRVFDEVKKRPRFVVSNSLNAERIEDHV